MIFHLSQPVLRGAERHPDHIAIQFGDERLTYGQLASESLRLAHVLKEHGLQKGDRVGIYTKKSLEAIVAVHGIMLAGGAYVPLDPFAPTARISFVVRDCDIRILISREGKLPQLEEVARSAENLHTVIGLSQDPGLSLRALGWQEVRAASPNAVDFTGLTEFDLAYILYTSGSTGDPKGIMHSHRSGLSFAEWAAYTYGLGSSDRVSNHAPLHFDLSTFDFFAGSVAGATTVIIPESITKFPASLSKLIQDVGITVWYSVPFALTQMLIYGNLDERDLSSLRWVLFAGEPFPTKHLRRLMERLPNARFSNMYGPTETNVCTYYDVAPLPEDSNDPIPIGRPCANIETLVMDSNDQPTQPGEVGELLVRGGTVMKGYWGQPKWTERGFYRRSALGYLEESFYRTGDLVRLLQDGNYAYLGRKDRQIKSRGYRVELDEIEVLLLEHPSVNEVAAYAVPDGEGSNVIESTVVVTEGALIDVPSLLNHLAERLPSYALPAKLTFADEFPRTSTGKIDRRRLQELATAAAANS